MVLTEVTELLCRFGKQELFFLLTAELSVTLFIYCIFFVSTCWFFILTCPGAQFTNDLTTYLMIIS